MTRKSPPAPASELPPAASPRPGPSALIYWTVMALCIVVCLAPIWLIEYLPLVDYSNHLGRMCVIHDWGSSPFFQYYFSRVSPNLVPNQAMETLVPLLLNWLDVVTAGKLFLTLSLLLLAVAAHLLGREAWNEHHWLAPSVLFLFYNSMLFYGYANYMFGVALFPLAYLAWLRLSQEFRWGRLILAGALAVACFFAHLSAVCFLGLAVGITLLHAFFRAKRLPRAAWLSLFAFLPVMVLYLWPKGYASDGGVVMWGSPLKRLIHLVPFLLTYNYAFDVAIGLCWAALAAIAFWKARPQVNWRLGTVAAGFLLAALLTPTFLAGGADADARLIIPAMVLGLSSVRFRAPGPLCGLLLAALLATQAVRVAVVAAEWRAGDRLERRQIALIDRLPVHARVYPLYGSLDDPATSKRERHLLHGVCYATVRRAAFVRTLFGVPGQHVLVHRRIAGFPSEYEFTNQPWDRVAREFDYLFTFRLSPTELAFLDRRFQLVAHDDLMRLYRVVR